MCCCCMKHIRARLLNLPPASSLLTALHSHSHVKTVKRAYRFTQQPIGRRAHQMMSWPSADELWLFQHHQQNSAPVATLLSNHKMQDKEHKQISGAAHTAQQQQQHNGSTWQKLQHHKAPAQKTAADNSNLHTLPAAAAAAGAERPAWLSFLQGMLDAHQQHHLDGISVSRGNSSIKHNKSSSSSMQGHRKGHQGLAAPTAAVVAAAAKVAAADDSSAADDDAVAVPHAATPHAAWPVCWPYN